MRNEGPGSYPKVSPEYRCDWITEIISVIDIYEALTAARPYKKGLSSAKAFEVMMQMPGLKQRRHILRLLYDCFGPFPVGEHVELSTGERAIVLKRNTTAPRWPTVQILTDRRCQPLDEPVDINLESAWRQEGQDQRRILRPIIVHAIDDDPLQIDIAPEPDEFLGSPVTDDAALMLQEG